MALRIWKDLILVYIGGMAYVLIELLWRGWSHPSMFLVGGLSFLLIGGINEFLLTEEMPLLFQAVLGAVAVTALELASGLVVNVWLGMHVWDYSAMPMNFLGQICMGYFFLWILLSGGAVFADDFLRMALFHEPKVKYRLL